MPSVENLEHIPKSSPLCETTMHTVKRELQLNVANSCDLPVWDYEDFMLEPLDEGYFGAVYKATHYKTKEVSVLKILKPYHEDEDDESREMFIEEIRLLCKLCHPNVLKCKGLTSESGNLAYLSEYIDGGSLQNLLQKQDILKLSWQTYLNIALDVARGMAYLHMQHVIHRDLNSKNVVVRLVERWKYEAVIIDLGLSYQKSETQLPEKEIPSGPVGSPFHIAPELFNMEPCSKKADVFSYGIILCEMISGCPGASPEELPRTRDFGLNVEEFSEMASDCPTELLNLAVRCCQVKSHLRPHFIDIVKMIDIILDRYEEDELNKLISLENLSKSPDELTTVNDDCIIESSLLCTCKMTGRLKSQTFSEDSVGFRLKTVYDRFGEVRRTSSRRLIRKYVRRCTMCGGRIMTFEELKRNSAGHDGDNDSVHSGEIDVQVKCLNRAHSLPSVAKNDGEVERIISNSSVDKDNNINLHEDLNRPITISGVSDIKNKGNISNNMVENDGGIVMKNSSGPAIPGSDPMYGPDISANDPVCVPGISANDPVYVPDISANDPVYEPDISGKDPVYAPDISVQEKGDLNEDFQAVSPRSSFEKSVKFPAAVLLRQNRDDISSKTSQLAQNTPGRLPRFFHHLLRRHKSRLTFTKVDDPNCVPSSERRSVRLSLQKLFHTTSHNSSTSGNLLSPHDAVVGLRMTSTRTKNEQNDYETRRRSMPVTMRHHHTSTVPNHTKFRPLSPGALSLGPERHDEFTFSFNQSTLHENVSKNSPDSSSSKQPDRLLKEKRSRSFVDLLLRKKNSFF